MWRGDPVEAASPVNGLPALVVKYPHRVRVLRVSEDVLVVPGTPLQVPVVADQPPGISPVVGTVQAAVLGLDGGPHPPWFGGGYSDADASLEAAGQAGVVGNLGPGVTPVHRLEDAAFRTAADEAPGCAPGLPDGGVEDAGVVGVQGQVHCPGVLAAEQDPLPGVPSVPGAVYAPLLVGAVGVSQGRHVHQVRVGGVYPYPSNVPRIGQAHVGPGPAAVSGPVHPVPVGHVPADAGLPHAGVNHVGVGTGDGDGAHRGGVEVTVGNILPIGTAVGGLPYPAGARAEVKHEGIDGVAGYRHHPSAPGWTDAAPPHCAEQLLRDGGSRGLVLLRFARRHRSTYPFKVCTCRGALLPVAQADARWGIIPLRTRVCRGMCSKLDFAQKLDKL